MKYFVIAFLLVSCATDKVKEEMPETVSESEFRNEVNQLESRKESVENINEGNSTNEKSSLIYSEERRKSVSFFKALDTISFDSVAIEVFEVKGVPFTRRERQDFEIEQRNLLKKLIENSDNELIKDSFILHYNKFILFQDRDKLDTVNIQESNQEIEDLSLADDILLLDYIEEAELIFTQVRYKDFDMLRLIDREGKSIVIDERPIFNHNWDMLITIFDTYGLTEPFLNIYKKEGNGFKILISLRLSELPSRYGRLVDPLWIDERSFLLYSSDVMARDKKYLGFRIVE